jgi:hypothetical protein
MVYASRLSAFLPTFQSINKEKSTPLEYYSTLYWKRFPHFTEIETAKDAASDHAALWVDLNV